MHFELETVNFMSYIYYDILCILCMHIFIYIYIYVIVRIRTCHQLIQITLIKLMILSDRYCNVITSKQDILEFT
jgi:cytochrome c oxidase assembly factor CtaG